MPTKDDQGDDLLEYTLMLAFICFVSAAMLVSAGGGAWIWDNTPQVTAVNGAGS